MTVTAVNAMATIENLHFEGTFVTSSAVSATAIPINTIGLYQLLDRISEDVSSLRATLRANEIVLNADLVADFVGPITPTDPVFVSTLESATATFNDRDDLSGITNTKPSLLDDGTNRFSEDAIFQFFSQITYEISKFRYNLATGDNNTAGATGPGLSAIRIAAA